MLPAYGLFSRSTKRNPPGDGKKDVINFKRINFKRGLIFGIKSPMTIPELLNKDKQINKIVMVNSIISLGVQAQTRYVSTLL